MTRVATTPLRSTWPDGSTCGAVFSVDLIHRFHLWRVEPDAPKYAGDRPRFPLFVMLNPSTATHEVSDPTITRCAGFARAWGYHSFQVVNLFSLRATDPRMLHNLVIDECDVENLKWIMASAVEADVVVCAWGVHGVLRDQDALVISALHALGLGSKLRCLGVTQGGHPRHPLYLAGRTPLQPFIPHHTELSPETASLPFDEGGN